MMARTETAAGSISAETAARLLMVTPRRLHQLAAAGWIERVGHGRYTMVGVVQGYLRFRDEAKRRRDATHEGDVELRRARTREVEQRIAQRDAQLIDIEEHRAVFDEAMTILTMEAAKLPPAVPRQVRKRVRQEIDDILKRARQRFDRATAELVATGRAPTLASPEDSA